MEYMNFIQEERTKSVPNSALINLLEKTLKRIGDLENRVKELEYEKNQTNVKLS